MTSSDSSDPTVQHATEHWLDRAVIGLNLCPFAKAVRRQGRVRFVVSQARTRRSLLIALEAELSLLARTDARRLETTLLIHPSVLTRFADFNDFLDPAEELIRQLGLEGVLQIASFHPRYRSAGVRPDDPVNLSHRSPYPTLHLLREASIAAAVASQDDADRIVERNSRLLQKLGARGWSQHLGMPSSSTSVTSRRGGKR